MKILCLFKSRRLFSFTAALLPSENFSLTFCDRFSLAFSRIVIEKENFDLVISDICFQQSNITLQQLLSSDDNFTPLIFYNDPYCRDFSVENKMWYYLKQNIRCFSLHQMKQKEFIYRKIFANFARIFTKNDFKDYISESTNLEDENHETKHLNETKNKNCSLSLESAMSPALSKLFFHFKKNLSRDICSDDISNLLFKRKSRSSTYTYISRLKKELSKTNENFSIIRTDKGKYRMISTKITSEIP